MEENRSSLQTITYEWRKKMPKISIIIPCYNVEKYISKCLDSVINQTYSDVEVICIDDGSADKTNVILHEYQSMDSRIQIIEQNNFGVAKARNQGIQAAHGEYIMFIDGDDWIDKDTCETAVKEAEKLHTDVVIWSYIREYPKHSLETFVLGKQKKNWNADTIDELYCRLIGLTKKQLREPQKIDALVTVWGKLYRKTLLQGVLFRGTEQIGATGEDFIFNVEVFRKVKSAVYLEGTFSHYRKDNTHSITSGYKFDLAEMWEKQYDIVRKKLEREEKTEIFFEALSNRIALGLIGLGISLTADDSICNREKRNELKRLLELPQYKQALFKLDIQYMPIYWKIFFFCAKRGRICILLHILQVMNGLRCRR